MKQLFLDNIKILVVDEDPKNHQELITLYKLPYFIIDSAENSNAAI